MATNNKYILNENDKKYAELNLNETEANKNKCVKLIRKWLKGHPNINGKLDEESIVPFLRGCKYDIERTKTKMQKFYMMKTDVPEWFSNRDPSAQIIQDLIKRGVFVPLKDTHDNMFVVVVRVAAQDPKQYHFNDVIKAGLMILDIASMENELLQIYGVIAIFDLENVSFEHAKQLTPYIIKRIVNAWQNYHCRPKQLEFINAPFYINVILKIFKSFMNEKLKRRIRVHPYGKEYTHEIVTPNILPSEYDGGQESILLMAENVANRLLTYKDWFKEDENYKTISD